MRSKLCGLVPSTVTKRVLIKSVNNCHDALEVMVGNELMYSAYRRWGMDFNAIAI